MQLTLLDYQLNYCSNLFSRAQNSMDFHRHKTRLNLLYGKKKNKWRVNEMNENNNLQPAEPKEELSLDEGDLAIAQEETEDVPKKKKVQSNTEELDIDDMGADWIKNPAVGESTEVLTIKTIMKNTNITAKRKDGGTFSTALSKVDYKIDIHTDKGIFCPSCWEVWGKIKAAVRKNKELTGAKIEGTQFSVKHLVNGIYANKSVEEIRKLQELPNTDEGRAQAEALSKAAKEARVQKKCYQVVLYLPDGKTIVF